MSDVTGEASVPANHWCEGMSAIREEESAERENEAPRRAPTCVPLLNQTCVSLALSQCRRTVENKHLDGKMSFAPYWCCQRYTAAHQTNQHWNTPFKLWTNVKQSVLKEKDLTCRIMHISPIFPIPKTHQSISLGPSWKQVEGIWGKSWREHLESHERRGQPSVIWTFLLESAPAAAAGQRAGQARVSIFAWSLKSEQQ